MKRYLILLLFMGLCIGQVLAQGGRRSQIEQFRKQFIEEKLGLSGTEAAQFWEVYNQYEQERKGVRQEVRKLKASFNALSDADLENAIQRFFTLQEKELQIDKKYFKELKKVLTIRQIAVLYQAENTFKRELLKRIKENRQNGGGNFGNK